MNRIPEFLGAQTHTLAFPKRRPVPKWIEIVHVIVHDIGASAHGLLGYIMTEAEWIALNVAEDGAFVPLEAPEPDPPNAAIPYKQWAIAGDGTFETFKYLSRRHVKLSGREDHVLVKDISYSKNTTSINGKIVVFNTDTKFSPGDTLTLLTPLNIFHYRLETRQVPQRIIVDLAPSKKRSAETAELDTISSAPPPTAAPAAVPSPKPPRELTELTDCTICLEPMALSHSLNPCGHSCCYSCLIDWLNKDPKCPTCSAPATGLLPSHFADSIIHQVLKDDAAGLADWEARVEEGKQRKRQGDKWGNAKQPDPKPAPPANPQPHTPAPALQRVSSIVVDLTDAPEPPLRATIVQDNGASIGHLSYATKSTSRCIQCNNPIQAQALQVNILPFAALPNGGVLHGACVDSYNRMRRFLDGPTSSTTIKLKNIKHLNALEKADQRYLRNLLR